MAGGATTEEEEEDDDDDDDACEFGNTSVIPACNVKVGARDCHPCHTESTPAHREAASDLRLQRQRG